LAAFFGTNRRFYPDSGIKIKKFWYL